MLVSLLSFLFLVFLTAGFFSYRFLRAFEIAKAVEVIKTLIDIFQMSSRVYLQVDPDTLEFQGDSEKTTDKIKADLLPILSKRIKKLLQRERIDLNAMIFNQIRLAVLYEQKRMKERRFFS